MCVVTPCPCCNPRPCPPVLQLPSDTLIQVWMGDMADVSRAISLGYNVLYSTCWYLDHVEYGAKWPKYYQCDPADASYGACAVRLHTSSLCLSL